MRDKLKKTSMPVDTTVQLGARGDLEDLEEKIKGNSQQNCT